MTAPRRTSMLSGIGQQTLYNSCSSTAINVRLQPRLEKGRDDPRGRKRNFRLERFTALDGSLSVWGEPCGIRLFGNRRYMRSYVIGFRPSPEICPSRGSVANTATTNRNQRHRAGLCPIHPDPLLWFRCCIDYFDWRDAV